ncbi:MAG: DnaA/Hda family protein [Syntrophorhabdaceae bacterium]|nr:DnaA/Hda family protein [Syntrophorhabdaceae bacterium]
MKIMDTPNPEMTPIESEFIDNKSQIFLDLDIPLLLNCTVKRFKDRIVIETSNALSKKEIIQRLQELKDYFSQDVVVRTTTATVVTEPDKGMRTPAQQAKRGSLSGRISAEYVETPYIVGASNKFAYDFTRRLLMHTEEGQILFLYGDSGTGKSHLLHQLANDFLEMGKNVYLTRGNDFVETIKARYLAKTDAGSRKKSFLAELRKYDLYIIDDFQYLYQEQLLKFIPDPLFEIIVQQLEAGNVLAFSSDTPPTFANPHFYERIVNRLIAGLVAQLELPDMDMKRAYVRYFCEKNEFSITPEMEKYIFTIAKNLRTVKGILSYCHALHEQKDLRIDKLVEITGKIFGGIGAVRKSTEQGIVESIYSLLKEYYGIPDETIKKIEEGKQVRKPRALAKIDSIAYYLLHDKVADRDYLKKYLHIKYNTEGYCISRGEEFYNTMIQSVKDEIEKILSVDTESIKSGQGALWEQ